MYKLNLVAVGDKMPSWVDQGCQHYLKQIKRRIEFKTLEVAALKRGKNADITRIIRNEEEKIRKVIPVGSRIIALERTGVLHSSKDLSAQIGKWIDLGTPSTLVIGGPEGLSAEFLSECDEIWSLSKMTMAHTVVRLVLMEQIYRSLSILDGSPYHR